MKSTNFHCSAGITLMLATSFAYAFSLFGNDPIDVVKDSFLAYDDTASIGKVFNAYPFCTNKKWEKIETERGQQIVQFSCNRYVTTDEVDRTLNKMKLENSATLEELHTMIADFISNPETYVSRYESFIKNEGAAVYNEIVRALKSKNKINEAIVHRSAINEFNRFRVIGHDTLEVIEKYNRAIDDYDGWTKNFESRKNFYYKSMIEQRVQFAFINNSKKDFKVLTTRVRAHFPNAGKTVSWKPDCATSKEFIKTCLYGNEDIQNYVSHAGFWDIVTMYE